MGSFTDYSAVGAVSASPESEFEKLIARRSGYTPSQCPRSHELSKFRALVEPELSDINVVLKAPQLLGRRSYCFPCQEIHTIP